MATLTSFFSFLSSATAAEEFPDIFPLSIKQSDFVESDVRAIYARILGDVLERTQGVPEKALPLLFDNCLASEASEGLVTILARAMTAKSELFLVYDKATNVVRKATMEEEQQIKTDYAARAESKIGLYITFKTYTRTDMLKLYSSLEYCDVASLYKSMNLSKAVQVKVSELRSSTGNADKNEAILQAKAIASGLSKGKDVLLDAKDTLETAKPDLTATNAAMEFINQKRSFYLGLPASWITGLAPKGLGDSGDGDAKSVERGLKGYYFAIVKPVIETLFGGTTTFKTEDFKAIDSSLEALKTFELTGDELLSKENKRLIVGKLFGIPEGEKADENQTVQQALNGAQVTSLVAIVEKTAAGLIPRESAVAMVVAAFNVSDQVAEGILSKAGKGFTPTPPEPKPGPGAPAQVKPPVA